MALYSVVAPAKDVRTLSSTAFFYYLFNNTNSIYKLSTAVKVLLRRKFLFLFPSFFNINLLFMFKIIQIAKNWSDTCVRGLEISH